MVCLGRPRPCLCLQKASLLPMLIRPGILTVFYPTPQNPATYQPLERGQSTHTPYLTPFPPQPSLDRADCRREKWPSHSPIPQGPLGPTQPEG